MDENWKVHRKPGARRVAVREPHWHKPVYLTPDVARQLMLDIAECLGVEGPQVEIPPRCDSTFKIDRETFRCMAEADHHALPTHYWKDGDVTIRWV